MKNFFTALVKTNIFRGLTAENIDGLIARQALST